jgi:hypothetical protein
MQLQILEALRKPETRKTSRSERPLSISLTAELIGSHRCECESHGIRTVGHAPGLAMCRKLLAAGANPDMALAIYRGGSLRFESAQSVNALASPLKLPNRALQGSV